MRHFQVSCPRCGSQSWIRMDKLGMQLHCEKCGTEFYLDASGNYARGKRPANLRTPDVLGSGGRVTRASYSGVERLEGVPKAAWIAGAGLLLIGVVAYALLFATLSGGTLPNTLEARAVYVAEAFARGRGERIEAIRAPGPRRDVDQWLAKSRPSYWGWTEGDPIEVDVEVRIRDERTGVAYVIATIVTPRADRPADDPGATFGFELPLHWVLDDHGQWVLNTSKTLDFGPRSS